MFVNGGSGPSRNSLQFRISSITVLTIAIFEAAESRARALIQPTGCKASKPQPHIKKTIAPKVNSCFKQSRNANTGAVANHAETPELLTDFP
jgi:hypothetical protein